MVPFKVIPVLVYPVTHHIEYPVTMERHCLLHYILTYSLVYITSVSIERACVLVKQVSHCPETDPRWTHEYVPSAVPSDFFDFFWHAKDFANTPKVDADAGETQPGFI